MNCRRADELFSDYHDGTLAAPMASELSTHLEGCAQCAELYRAFVDVREALSAITVPSAPERLAPHLVTAIAEASARRDAPAAERYVWLTPRKMAVATWFAVAAMLAMVLVIRPPELASELTLQTSRGARHVYTFTTRTMHRAERWLEDLNLLRMTVGVAFEDRIERLNEQLRELEDASRRSEDDQRSWFEGEASGSDGISRRML